MSLEVRCNISADSGSGALFTLIRGIGIDFLCEFSSSMAQLLLRGDGIGSGSKGEERKNMAGVVETYGCKAPCW